MSAESNTSTPASQPALWAACMEVLAQQIPPQQFNTWIKPLQVRENGDTGLLIEVESRFKLDWVRKQYLQVIKEAAAQVATGQPVEIELGIAKRAPRTAVARVPRPAVAAPVAPHYPPPVQSDPVWQEVSADAPMATPKQATRLNPSLTFDNLIEGTANRIPRASAMYVAERPGEPGYNPMFIYGGVGLGKTHLLQAIGNQFLANNPDARVLYIHAEQFVNDVVQSYRRKAFDELKARYHSLDLLLIDDVQFFAGKDRTQDEFFNAFEALMSKRSQIVMTSDTMPREMVDMTERLVSRFGSGLSVSMMVPELEMRVAILLKKAHNAGFTLPEDVAFFIAKHIRANVRELEGTLQSVLAYAKFGGRQLDLNLVREAMHDQLSVKNRQVSIENIQKTVAEYYRIKVADMHSKRRPANIARPRQIAMYLVKELTTHSLPEIGEAFGGRDHTTVLHAVRKIAGDRSKDTKLQQELTVLEQTIKG